nr:putative integron gene cassette protein [uncultured bacterium]
MCVTLAAAFGTTLRPLVLLSIFALVVARLRWLARCARLFHLARSQNHALTARGLARGRRMPLPLGFVERLARLRRQCPAPSFPMHSAFPNSRRA